MNKIMHVSSNSERYPNKFVPNYSILAKSNFKNSEHDFYYIGDDYGLDLNNVKDVFSNSIFSGFKILSIMRGYDKIIFHSIPSLKVSFILSFLLMFYKNKDLVVWGGEIHHKGSVNNSLRDYILEYTLKVFLKNCDGFITYIKEDFELIKEKFNSSANWVDLGSFYPSNIVNNYSIDKDKKVESDKTNILIGVSALSRNNHFKIIDLIKDDIREYDNVEVFIPLSYGDVTYAKKVEAYAKNKLDMCNVNAIYDFMAYDEYISFLETIDIAIYDHDGQQGMGNIRNLIGMGKKIYLNDNSVSWRYLSELGFEVFDNKEKIVFNKIILNNNIKISAKEFSYLSTIKKQRNYYEFS